MMKPLAYFQVITLFPELIEAFASSGVVGQARKKEILKIESLNPRQFTRDVHQSVDDRPFGGGDGMTMMVEPLSQAIESCIQSRPRARRIYLSPQGRRLDMDLVRSLAGNQASLPLQPRSVASESASQDEGVATDLILLCGRYAGVDQRLLVQYAFEEVSIGDYVISGGEIAAMIVIDAVARFLPGVLGHVDSASHDSFAGGLLEAPLYTRPREVNGMPVPEVLVGGNHRQIEVWRRQVSLLVTQMKRPDLQPLRQLEEKELQLLREFWQSLAVEEKRVLGFGDWQWNGSRDR